jgi:chromate transport protein ChrA
MNLDELMAVWRSQDAAPLHDVNQTLLHLALRQDEAALQKQRRRERWIIYVASAGVAGVMVLFLAMMIYARDRNVITGWDFLIAVGGAAAALIAGAAMYVGHRAQARREQRFGESLRDQLNRRIAQLDDAATRTRRTNVLVIVLMGGICPTALLLLGLRINQQSLSDNGGMLVPLILTCVWMVAAGIWEIRRQARTVLPRKHRLEALLKELNAP